MEPLSPERVERIASLPSETRAVLLKAPLSERMEQALIARYHNADLTVEQRVPTLWLLKARGWTTRRIAKALGVHVQTVTVALKRARDSGKLAPLSVQFDHDIAQLAADNIQETLEAGGVEAQQLNVDVARGLGYFKSHQAIKAETIHEGSLVLGLKLEVPEGTTPQPIGTGTTIAGTPRQLTPGDDHGAPSAPAEQE